MPGESLPEVEEAVLNCRIMNGKKQLAVILLVSILVLAGCSARSQKTPAYTQGSGATRAGEVTPETHESTSAVTEGTTLPQGPQQQTVPTQGQSTTAPTETVTQPTQSILQGIELPEDRWDD